MAKSDDHLKDYIETLTEEIKAWALEEARKQLVSELGGALVMRPTSKPGPKPKTVATRARGGKRDPAEIDALTNELFAAIRKTPGQGVEQIGKALGVATKDLALPVKRLLAEKKVKTTGVRRATRYYPK